MSTNALQVEKMLTRLAGQRDCGLYLRHRHPVHRIGPTEAQPPDHPKSFRMAGRTADEYDSRSRCASDAGRCRRYVRRRRRATLHQRHQRFDGLLCHSTKTIARGGCHSEVFGWVFANKSSVEFMTLLSTIYTSPLMAALLRYFRT